MPSTLHRAASRVDHVAWPELNFSKTEVKRAGKILRRHATEVLTTSEDEVAWARRVARNWRQAHAEAENWAQMGCRSRLGTLNVKGDVTQRLKELPTIVQKLVREDQRVQLSTMEDIAGARAVVPTLGDLRRLESKWLTLRQYTIHRHRDYVDTPPDSGYRAVHLVLRHRLDRQVEVQLRTELQHAWAELVEDCGHLLGVSVKNGEGPADLLGELRALSDRLAPAKDDRLYDRADAQSQIADLRTYIRGQYGGSHDH